MSRLSAIARTHEVLTAGDWVGYDLRDLFIGSEGTLGVITGAVLKLFSQPHARATAWVGCDSLAQLAELLARTRARCGDRLVAFETASGGNSKGSRSISRELGT